MSLLPIVVALAAISLPAFLPAQSTPCGILDTTSPGATSRGRVGMAAGQLLCRFDHDDYRGLGAGPTGGTELTGLRALIQDQDGSTPEVVSLHVYGEQPGVPDFPTQPAAAAPGTAALASVANLSLFGSGPPVTVATMLTINFATPLAAPAGQDLFFGIELGSAPSWPFEGASLQVHSPLSIPAGPGPIAQGSYFLDHDPARALLAYNPAALQGMIEPLVDGRRGRGVALAVVRIGGLEVRTGSFLTGLHPDVASPPLNPGRADDLGYVVFGGGPLDILAWFGDVAGSFRAVPLLLAPILPGGQGQFCLQGSAILLGLRLGSGSGADRFEMALTPGQRPVLRGIDFTSQGVVARFGGGLVGTPCARQRL